MTLKPESRFPELGQKLIFNGIAYSHLLHTLHVDRSHGESQRLSESSLPFARRFVRCIHMFESISLLKDLKKWIKMIRDAVSVEFCQHSSTCAQTPSTAHTGILLWLLISH